MTEDPSSAENSSYNATSHVFKIGNSDRCVFMSTIEFADPIFSGNGTYGRVIVDGIHQCWEADANGKHLDNNHIVFLLCAVPKPREEGIEGDSWKPLSPVVSLYKAHNEVYNGITVVLPCAVDEAKWGRLDYNSDWVGFATEAAKSFDFALSKVSTLPLSQHSPSEGTRGNQHNLIWWCTAAELLKMAFLTQNKDKASNKKFICVDWTGYIALRAIVGIVGSFIGNVSHECAEKNFFLRCVCFLSFRVFGISLSEILHEDEESDELNACHSISNQTMAITNVHESFTDDCTYFYRIWESEAITHCKSSASLSYYDNVCLLRHLNMILNKVTSLQTHIPSDCGLTKYKMLELKGHKTKYFIPSWILLSMEQQTTSKSSTYGMVDLVSHAKTVLSFVMCPVRDEVMKCRHLFNTDGWKFEYLPAELRNILQHPDHSNVLHALQQTDVHSEDPPRLFIASAVRISPEKTPINFVKVVEKLWLLKKNNSSKSVFREDQNHLKRSLFVPLLFGSSPPNSEYAKEVKRRFLEVTEGNGIVLESFMNPSELSALFKICLLNFHPCIYDSFALTITEAAVHGCPSMIPCSMNHTQQIDICNNSPGIDVPIMPKVVWTAKVGAAALVSPNEGASIPYIFERENTVAGSVMSSDALCPRGGEGYPSSFLFPYTSSNISNASYCRIAVDIWRLLSRKVNGGDTIQQVADAAQRKSLAYNTMSCGRSILAL
eukprot:Tbor_TRINITY_DN3019_c0_g1::TRINITY_DN3019_c0_g1_i1::g.17429::m.17429